MTDEHLVAVDLAQVGLRADPSTLPFEQPGPNHTSTWDGRDVMWLGPDEWLVLGPPHASAEIVGELRTALDGSHRSVIDVSSNRVAIELGGPGRFDLLASGCPIDLHPRSWRRGMCAQSLFAKT